MWAQPQRKPDIQKKYALTGKVNDLVDFLVSADSKVRTFWAPDFAVYVEQGDDIVEIASVTERGVTWQQQGLDRLGVPDPRAAEHRMRSFKRKSH